MMQTDYVLEMKRFTVDMQREYGHAMLALMESESDFMLSCLESMEIVDGLEAITEAKNALSNIWEKIKEFFRKIVSIFTKKARDFTKSDQKWLNDNKDRLVKMDVSDISLELLPYWNMTTDKIKGTIQNTLNQLFRDIKSSKRLAINTIGKSTVGAKAIQFDIMKKYDNGDGGVEGFKNFLRTGSVNGSKPVTLEGPQLKLRIPQFIVYCIKYEQEIVPFIKQQVTEIDKEIKQIETRMNSIKEHTLFIEDCSISESELRYCPGFEAILEAPTDNKVSVTAVNVKTGDVQKNENNNKSDDKEKQEEKQPDRSEDYKNASKAELTYLKQGLQHCKLVVSAAMTVFEEKYITYMKVLRAVAVNGGTSTRIQDNNKETDKTDDKKEEKK